MGGANFGTPGYPPTSSCGPNYGDPPTVWNVQIHPFCTGYPCPAMFPVITSSDNAYCIYQASADTISVEFQFQINQGSPAEESHHPPSHFNAGDVLTCNVRAFDGHYYSDWVVSNPMTVQNSPPTISSVALTPTNAYAGDTLVCTASGANDIDGDAITFSYEWIVNGISSGNGATYNGAINGDTVNCMITPYDGTSYGPAVSSNSITIQNSAPSISSVAIGYSTQQHTSGTFAGDQLTCTPSGGSDADGDVLTYAYTWYLNGVSHSTTQNLDTTGMSSGDVVYCSVVANDGTDNSAAVNSASTTVYTIHNINIQNMAYSPSSITITQGDILIWTNLDSVGHTVTADGSTPLFNSGTLTNGQTYTLTGLSAGTYTYHCQPHPSMTGTIIVQ